MVNIAVVEDVRQERDRLSSLVSEFFSHAEPSCKIYEFSDGANLLDDCPVKLDIIFMDIEMKHLDGLAAARAMRARDEDVIIIFVTNLAQHALEGYAVNALSFILKPVTPTKIASELQRALGIIARKKVEKLLIKSSEGLFRVRICDIHYIEAESHRIRIFLADSDIVGLSSIKSLEEELAGKGFFRCHSAFLVNLEHIERVSGSSLWLLNRPIPMSRQRKKEFGEAFADFLRGAF